MPSHAFPTCRSAAPLVALDFGLCLRIAATKQRPLFTGAESLSLRELVSELSQMVSGLRVRSFSLRFEVERVTTALLTNVECGFWLLAQHAAMDLGDLLAEARRRHLADAELCLRGSNCASRIAELCSKEAC
jgi:hypothetical protein